MTAKKKANNGAKSVKKSSKKAADTSLKVEAIPVAAPTVGKREVRYKVIGEVPEKLSPQARTIIELIANYGDEGVSRHQLIEELKPLLKTRQPTERVLAFYTVVLKHDGLISSEKISA
jgi:DNA-binding response OmpR family regulator